MAFTLQTPWLGYPKIGAVVLSTDSYIVNAPKIGTIAVATDPVYGSGEFIWLSGVASTVRGSVALYNTDDFSTTLTVADLKGPLCVAMGATVASTAGWYQISGKGVARVATGFLDNADCYLTATPGVVDDAVVSGDYIYNMKGASAIGVPAAGLAEVELARPFVTDGN